MKKQNPSHKRLLSAKPSSTTDCTPHYRQGPLSILVIGVFLLGCSGLPGEAVDPMMPGTAEFTFDQYEVVTGAAKHQIVLTGFLLDDTIAELVVVSIDEENDRRLNIYAFDHGSWALRLEATLRPEVLFVDVVNIDGRDRLVMYERGRLNWFNPESATEHPLVAVTSNTLPPKGEIPHVDVTRDLNGDGRDDLVVPDSDGFWVFIQMDNGAFADPVKIGPPIEMSRIYAADGYRYDPWSQGRVHEMDYNRDGRSDLVFWNEDHFEVHLQDERGLFAPVAKTFTTDVVFDSDDPASLAAPQEVRRRRRDHQLTGATTGRVLHSLTDMNGDGVADLVVFSLEIRSMWSVHFAYEVHFGAPTSDGGTMFAPDVGSAIRSDGLPFGLVPHDFDHDGQVDMMYATMKFGIFKTIGMISRAMLTRSVRMHLEFYRMERGIYPDKPNATRKIKGHAPGVSGKKGIFHPSVLIGDVNGDALSDLLVQKGPEELRVYLGVPGPKLFARGPQKIKVAMPNEEYTWLVDLNKDHKQDVLMHHPSTTKPHRVTILIAR